MKNLIAKFDSKVGNLLVKIGTPFMNWYLALEPHTDIETRLFGVLAILLMIFAAYINFYL